MKIYKTKSGYFTRRKMNYYRIEANWDEFINNDNLYQEYIEININTGIL